MVVLLAIVYINIQESWNEVKRLKEEISVDIKALKQEITETKKNPQ